MINIVCACDDQFALPLTVTLFSALQNLKQSTAAVYIIDSGISKKKKEKIKSILEIIPALSSLDWLNKNIEGNTKLLLTKTINRTTYLRILLPDLLPMLEKVIYLDADLIIDKDLTDLWDISFEDKLAVGVRDYYFHTISTQNAIPNYEAFGLNKDAVFCNAGVMVLNLKKWREESISPKIMAFVEQYMLNDQQGINAIFNGRWKTVSPRWNVTLSSINSFKPEFEKIGDGDIKSMLEYSFITHFTSRYKPWHLGWEPGALINNYYNQRERNRYFKYLKSSAWFSPLYFRLWIFFRKTILFFGMKLPVQLKNII